MREDRRKRYDDEFRHKALGLIKAGVGKHFHVDNDMAKTEVMAKYAIASVAPLERWCREYRTGGPEACISSNRGGRFQHLI